MRNKSDWNDGDFSVSMNPIAILLEDAVSRAIAQATKNYLQEKMLREMADFSGKCLVKSNDEFTQKK